MIVIMTVTMAMTMIATVLMKSVVSPAAEFFS